MMSVHHGIYIITGIMASGKTTIAQLLAEKCSKSVHVHGDLFRTMVVSGRAEMTMNPTEEAFRQLRLRYQLAAQTAQEYYGAGFTTILQDNYLGEEVHYFLSCFKSTPVYLITLCPSVQAVIAREVKRCKTGYTDWDVESLHNTLINENPRIGLWIDTSDQKPEETVNEIMARYEKEALIV